jgi:signal transduction histidine kinase
LESQARIRDVRVTFPVFETPCSVLADRIRLHEVLGNLLSTAIESSNTGESVVVHCAAHGSDWIRIGIKDGAQRLSVNKRVRDCPPFENLEKQSTEEDETGLGVMVAQRLVELMGGTFVVERVNGEKIGFSIDLKRVLIPLVAGRTLNRSTFGEKAISKENTT